jgi:2-hydroxy-3-oxopropionate reductase
MIYSKKTVGFIGTGLMGLPMAKNILAKKFKLHVWNRTPGKTLELKKGGAKVFSDIKDLVQNSKVIVSMFANDDVCKAVLIKKIQPYLKKGQIVIDMSSTTQNTALEIGKALKKKKVFFLDAPVSGGTIGAEKGTLAIMVGGDKKIFNVMMPLFKSMGTAIYVGKTGCGQVAKLANQTIVGISIGAVSEALILAEAAGADPKAVREIMLQGFAGGPILKNHGLRILTKNFKPGGKASTQLKDMNNIISTAKKYKLNLPIAKKVQELYAKTVKSGRANLDHSALYLFIKALSR